jgi:hypothetical protein
MARFAVFDEQGRTLDRTQLPGYRLLHGDTEAPPLLVRNVVLATGEERWLLNKASLVRGDDPRGASVVNVIEDLTAIKRAELRERLLSEATAELSRSLDYESTLQRVAEVAVPGLADWCTVSLPGPAGSVEEVAIAHSDPAKVALGRRLQAYRPSRMDDSSPRAAVLRGEAGTSLVQVPEGALEAFADDAEHLEMLRQVGLGSVLTVPLDAGGRRLGAMLLVRAAAALRPRGRRAGRGARRARGDGRAQRDPLHRARGDRRDAAARHPAAADAVDPRLVGRGALPPRRRDRRGRRRLLRCLPGR